MTPVDQIILSLLGTHAGPFFFVGSGKNAGKTTLLNRVNRVLSGAGRNIGVTTIGHDGEPFDAILGHAKPPVELFPGNLVCLTERMAADAGEALTLIGPAGHETAVGRLVLARCVRESRCEILGPETNAKCLDVCEKMEQLSAETILVDGAFHRRTQVAVRDRTALALIISGDVAHSLSEIESLTRHWVEIFGLPAAKSPIDFPVPLGFAETAGGVAVRGPLTEDIAAAILPIIAGRALHIEDATKIFCEPSTYNRLRDTSGGVFARRTFDLKLIAANPTARMKPGFAAPDFARAIKRAAPSLPVVDVVSEIIL